MAINSIKISQGLVKGIDQIDYTLFKGIPYAKPPVGKRRFKAPQPLNPSNAEWAADNFRPMCVQMESPGEFYKKEFYSNPAYDVPASEDCLYLNIWTPALSTFAKLPVALYIHGGGFLGGRGSELEFDGEAFCKQDVILVTINYRLNVFGFLAHPWQNESGEAGNSANIGFLDQIAALKWVYENIEAFGGDPDKITIFGQSAGCMSVQTLVSSELTGNMIHGAILQSGGGFNRAFMNGMTPDEAGAIGSRIVELSGAKSLEDLMALDAKSLLDALGQYMPEHMAKGGMLPFGPVIDGYLLKDELENLTESGRIKDIPYMIGSTEKDIAVDLDKLNAGDKGLLFTAAINWSLQNEKLFNRPSYVYYFTRDLPGDDAGAFHSSELWYMFGTLGRAWRPFAACDFELSSRMVTYWCNFMKHGDPNADDAPDWKPCQASDRHVQILDCR